jgi:hypothetical protein
VAWKFRNAGIALAIYSMAACLAVLVSGCSSKEPNQQIARGPVVALDPNTVGEIKGTVVLQGAPPPPQKILLSGEPECAQLNPNSLFSPAVTTGSNGALANVAVYIKSGLANYDFEAPKTPVELDQKNCMYQPRVLALMTNQLLDIQNEDPIQHNVHPTPHQNPAFNMTQVIHGPPIQKAFANPELAIRFTCNLHPWMRAYVFVFPHPYFDVTTTAGTFDLKDVPPGTYTIEAWQEKYGSQDQTVTIAPHESTSITFSFKS